VTGLELKQLRVAAGWTQIRLANEMHLSNRTVVRLEHDPGQIPDHYRALARELFGLVTHEDAPNYRPR